MFFMVLKGGGGQVLVDSIHHSLIFETYRSDPNVNKDVDRSKKKLQRIKG